MRKIIICLALISLTIGSVFAHSGKARYHVIIDTDCSSDDLRTISMILASPEFEVLAITTTDGILKSREGYIKVQSLLNDFGHQGIPVGYGKNISREFSKHHDLNIGIQWGNEEGIIIPESPNAIDLIQNSINNEDEKVVIICLGPLTNINSIAKDENYINQIEKIVWYCDNYQAKRGFNFEHNTKAAKEFTKSNIEKNIISNGENNAFTVNDKYLNSISNIKNQYAEKIIESHSSKEMNSIINSQFLKFWDDLIPSYLLFPDLYVSVKLNENTYTISPKQEPTKDIINSFSNILQSKASKECKVFKIFPIDSELFADDMISEVDEIISTHGLSEWRSCVITNELHGHLGIYAIIGVKMGARVRQYFNIGVDDIHITSFAGSKPPISCMTDGLQVSTGATLGHGLITISDEEIKRPEAIFQFKIQKVKLRLKDEYWNTIESDVKETIKTHGKLTPAYWLQIRVLAIKYWKEFDRMEIFEIEEIK